MPPSEHPAADFNARPLPIEIVMAGDVLFRSHREGYQPIYFSVGHPQNRFDDPDGVFGVCYTARSPAGAFAETFLRKRTGAFVDEEELRRRCVAELRATRELRLVAFYGTGLTSLKASAAVTTGAVMTAQRWAAAIHHHPDEPDGILYRVRHDNDQIGVSLFGRGSRSLVWVQSEPWLHSRYLDAICERYGLVL